MGGTLWCRSDRNTPWRGTSPPSGGAKPPADAWAVRVTRPSHRQSLTCISTPAGLDVIRSLIENLF
jgi:hypothetical protein